MTYPYREVMRRRDNADTRFLALAWCAAFIVAGFFLGFLGAALSAGGHH